MQIALPQSLRLQRPPSVSISVMRENGQPVCFVATIDGRQFRSIENDVVAEADRLIREAARFRGCVSFWSSDDGFSGMICDSWPSAVFRRRARILANKISY